MARINYGNSIPSEKKKTKQGNGRYTISQHQEAKHFMATTDLEAHRVHAVDDANQAEAKADDRRV